MHVELVADGFGFTEGPVWFADGDEQLGIRPGSLLVSDIEANRMMLLRDGDVSTFRSPSFGANGNTAGLTGELFTCEHGSRAVSRTDGNGRSIVVDHYRGARLNSPNDVVAGADGSIVFTDPPYGVDDDDRELSFQGVFRWKAGALELLADDLVKPNGVAIDPDGSTLLIADTETGHVWALDLAAPGYPRNLIATLSRPDGLKVLPDGRIAVACLDGICLLDGDRVETIEMPQRPANLAVVGDDVYVCARTAVYRIGGLTVPDRARQTVDG